MPGGRWVKETLPEKKGNSQASFPVLRPGTCGKDGDMAGAPKSEIAGIHRIQPNNPMTPPGRLAEGPIATSGATNFEPPAKNSTTLARSGPRSNENKPRPLTFPETQSHRILGDKQ